MFSKACEYAIKIMIYIAANGEKGKRTGLKEVTEAIDSPEAFTAKILQQLVKSRLLDSFKGPTGGFELASNAEIRLIDIVSAIDGDGLLENCVLGLSSCSSRNPCPVHDKFISIRNQLKETLLSTDIKDKDLLKDTKKLKA
ncbi:MAG: Rrf2 family iron-sulfur cluster assembly transcriptional regulator [Cyclobacteriaceae bacterium]|jgi:Rrf2 family iron-sulfur cluster assembly transcriptional regulator